jgi:glutaredoxin
MREGCAYCEQTKAQIHKKGGTYILVDMTNNPKLGNEVAKAAHSINVPVVTTAKSPAEFTHENMYVGWNLSKLNQFIERTS